jgi:hypothetical protein
MIPAIGASSAFHRQANYGSFRSWRSNPRLIDGAHPVCIAVADYFKKLMRV